MFPFVQYDSGWVSTARFQRCFNDQKRCKASQISDHVGSNSVVQLLKDGAKVNWTIDNPY